MNELVFICSAYSGDIKQNKENARKFCRYVIEQGHTPIAPHLYLTECLDDNNLEQREKGLELSIDILSRCERMLVFTPITRGMKGEIKHALENQIPIDYFDNYETKMILKGVNNE